MYIDILTGLKIPGIIILSSNKTFEEYDRLLKKIKNLIFGTGNEYLNLLTITLDFENSLIHAVIENFPNTKLIGCYYHYKAAIYREAQKLGYTKKKNIEETLDIINSNLSLIPFKIVENSEYAIKLLKDLRRKIKIIIFGLSHGENFLKTKCEFINK